MRYPARDTVCVSSQAGCAMACGFCATGQAGFDRHLSAGEIVEQVVRAAAPGRAHEGRRAGERRVHGHGRAARQLRRHVGRRRAASTTTSESRRAHLTRLDGRDRARHPPPRRRAPPGEPGGVAARRRRRAPRRARADQPPVPARHARRPRAPTTSTAKGRRLSFEWALIDGVNDRPADADGLAAALPAAAAARPREPDPAEPHARATPCAGTPAGRCARLPGPVRAISASTPRSAARAGRTSTRRAGSSAPTTRSGRRGRPSPDDDGSDPPA